MVSTAPSASPNPGAHDAGEVSPTRLHILRATYLLLIAGLGATSLPALFDHDPIARGVIPSFLGGIWLLALVGLRYPLGMLPLLLFELAWKAIWLVSYGLPQWASGRTPASFADDFPAIVAGVILMPVVIPWGHVWRRYVRQPAERWR
jgi:hypothetical protein